MERDTSDSVAEQAGFWDARLRAPDCTDDDRARFTQWRDASPECRAAFEKIQSIVTTFRSNTGRADVRALRDAALAIVHRRRKRRAWAAAAAVATLAIGAVIAATFQDRIWRAPLAQLAAMTDALLGRGHAATYETSIGQRSTVTLQDGSLVELNSRTRIQVVFNEATRNVALLEGQAFFHVARNPRRPFIVRAADRDITAVGTAFDVRLNATSVRVTLLEGKVKVTQEGDAPPGNAAKGTSSLPDSARGGQALQEPSSRKESLPQPPSRVRWGVMALRLSNEPGADHAGVRSPALRGGDSKEIYLSPGQQFVASLPIAGNRHTRIALLPNGTEAPVDIAGRTAIVRSIDVAKVIGWRDGYVFLEDLTLADAVAEMNRHSPVQIRVADSELGRLRVNGMFRAGEQDGFASALEQYFPIAVHHEGEMTIVLAKRT